MSTGSTAIDAIVSDAPASDSAPNVTAAADKAIASGSSRSARPEDEREHRRHDEQRDEQQQPQRAGDRVGEVRDDDGRAGHGVRRAVGRLERGERHRVAHEGDRGRALRGGQPGLQTYLYERRAATLGGPGGVGREEVGELALGRPRRLGGVEDERRDERRVVEPRHRGEPVARRERQQLAREARLGLLARLGAAAGGGRLGEPGAARPVAGRRVGGVGEHPRAHDLALVARAQLADRGVDERARAEHDLRGPRAAELRAGAARPARLRRARGDAAREAALEREQPLEVLAEQELLQVAADEHDDRVVAEALAQGLRRGVARAVGADERVDAGVGLKAQGRREPGEREHRGEHEDQPGPAGRERRRGVQRPEGLHGPGRVIPCRAGPPTRPRGTDGRTGCRSRRAGPPGRTRRCVPSTAPRCAGRHGARS